MTTTYKCDRCGEYIESSGHETLSGSIIARTLKPNWFPKYVDLCKKCSEELRAFLGTWWSKAMIISDK